MTGSASIKIAGHLQLSDGTPSEGGDPGRSASCDQSVVKKRWSGQTGRTQHQPPLQSITITDTATSSRIGNNRRLVTSYLKLLKVSVLTVQISIERFVYIS